MKKLIVIVVLLVVIAAGLPFLNGVLLERILRKAIDDANAMQAENPFGYSFEIVNYKRGYSTTDMELKLDMGILKDIYGIDSVTVREHAKHGTMKVVSTISLEDNEWYSSFLNERLDGKDPLHVETCYSLFGGIKSDVILDDFSTDIEDVTLHIKKAEFKVTSDRSLQNYNISGIWEGLDIDQKFSVNEVSMEMDMEMITRLLWDSDALINIKSIDFTEKGNNTKISDLKVQTLTDADVDTNTIGYDVHYNIGSIRSGDNNIEDTSVHLAVKGLKIDAFEEFRKTYFEKLSQVMSKIDLRDPGKLNDDQMRKEMAQMNIKMIAAYEKLLKEGLEIKVSDVRVNLPRGEIKGAVTLRLLQDMTVAQFLPFMNQPQDLFEALYIQTDISLPAKLVGESPLLLRPPVPDMKTGIFIKDGDYLVNKMETKNGKLFLNDNEVSLDKIISQLGPGPQAGNQYMK